MKTWGIFIGITIILVIICSPVLAISKSDLISFYKSQSAPTTPIPTPTPLIPSDYVLSPPAIPKWFDVFDSLFRMKGCFINETMGDRFIMKSADPGVTIYNDVGVGKPNIYLYSDRDLTAQVRLAPERAITVSEPVYQPGKGWRAEIRNGSLNGNGDFLFYEARSDSVWQKEEGYIIHAAYREQDMDFMLEQYGFNEKETKEFIDYWSIHLAGNVDFVFYPQETEAVNQDMPLSISPKPDNVMRIWFFAEPLESAPEPVTHPEKIVREGFYVVEWGVIIQNEYWIRSPHPALEAI